MQAAVQSCTMTLFPFTLYFSPLFVLTLNNHDVNICFELVSPTNVCFPLVLNPQCSGFKLGATFDLTLGGNIPSFSIQRKVVNKVNRLDLGLNFEDYTELGPEDGISIFIIVVRMGHLQNTKV
jgi:hypothetical protein